MGKFLVTLFFIFITLSPALCEESMLDMDMDFIDNPFKNQKPVTQQQFDDVMRQKTQRTKGLIQKFQEFLGRNNVENDPNLKNFRSESLGELGMNMRDIANMKPNVILSSAIMDSYGKIIPDGHYQIAVSKTNGIKLINFMQGNRLYGSVKTHNAKDNWEENLIIYARITYPTSGVARVIYSNLDGCIEGFAKIVEPQ